MNRNERKENQYVLLKITKDGETRNDVLLSSQEALSIDVYGDSIKDEPKFNESETPAYVCYGSYIAQSNVSKTQAVKDIKASMGCWHGFILDGKCYPVAIYDIEIIGIATLLNNKNVKLSFAALIKAPKLVVEMIDGLGNKAVTSFLRLKGAPFVSNLSNRDGIFALKGIAYNKNAIETNDWREFIDMNQAVSISNQIQ